ncbi:MAG: cyclase family protein [Firmicutes bacterium]|nr:cyclase family protein [Bacillota bacterium]
MIIDLSHDLTENTPVYPGDPAVGLTVSKTLDADGYTAYTLRAGMHAGTHVDAPMHMTRSEKTIGSFGAGCFCGKCAVLDARGKDAAGFMPEYAAAIRENEIILIRTGFDAYYSDPERYFGSHPVISPELADILIEGRIKMLGMDTPSPDRHPFALHKKLLGNGIFLLENLTNLGAVPAGRELELFAFPLKIGAEASPVRAVARVIYTNRYGVSRK